MAVVVAPVVSCPDIELSLKDEQENKRVSLIQRAQWLRAAILGANDGLLSVTALMLGVAAAKDDHGPGAMIVSGVAGALAGACSMAVGEFVSVSTQRDIEQTSKSESVNTQESPAVFSPPRSPFMKIVARDVGNEEGTLPNPYKAAGASALAFLCGSVIPILTAMAFSKHEAMRIVAVVVMTSIGLAMFGGGGARFGGSPVAVSATRVVVGGWISMAITYGLLKPFDKDREQ